MTKNEIIELCKSEDGLTISSDEERKEVLHAFGFSTQDEIDNRNRLIFSSVVILGVLCAIKFLTMM